MSPAQATAAVFWTAFKALPKAERDKFLCELVADKELREDLMDLAAVEERRHEKARPFASYVAERSTKYAGR